MFKTLKSKASSLGDQVSGLVGRNPVEFAGLVVSTGIAVAGGVVAAKATSTAIAVVGGIVAVGYGLSSVCWVGVIAYNELYGGSPIGTIDGSSSRVTE